MILAHSYDNATLAYLPGRVDVVPTSTGNVTQVRRTIAINFDFVPPGIPTRVIPTRSRHNVNTNRQGRLPSRLDTQIAVGKLNYQLELAGFKPITEDEFITWIKKHPSYGRDMIFVGEGTTDKYGDAEGYGDGIVSAGGGSFHCMPCDKHFTDKRGISTHQTSAAHLEALDRYQDPALSATG